MFTSTDYDKLEQLMAESPENEALIKKLLASHKETISTISHEIRNPLTLVYSTLQLIESRHPEVNSFRYWDSLRTDIEYMKQLLEDLSSFNNGASLCVKPLDFHKFMEQLVLSFAISCADSDIEFTSYLDPTLPEISGDSVKLREVFLNLLRNAKEAIHGVGRIRLEARYDNNIIHMTIQDSGCGIPEDYLSDIFTPFVTHKTGGTGLGLAIAKRTIESHNGNITVSSQIGTGTTFTITLPVSQMNSANYNSFADGVSNTEAHQGQIPR